MTAGAHDVGSVRGVSDVARSVTGRIDRIGRVLTGTPNGVGAATQQDDAGDDEKDVTDHCGLHTDWRRTMRAGMTMNA